MRLLASRTGRLYPQECSWYSFSLGPESSPGPWYILNVPSYNKYWPEDGMMKPKHVVKTVYYYWLYIDVVLWLNKILYEYWITQEDGFYQDGVIITLTSGECVRLVRSPSRINPEGRTLGAQSPPPHRVRTFGDDKKILSLSGNKPPTPSSPKNTRTSSSQAFLQ